ncbi:hypothetical protein M406DRAFT_103137, partial [Cryphonectria parasitica EP155]
GGPINPYVVCCGAYGQFLSSAQPFPQCPVLFFLPTILQSSDPTPPPSSSFNCQLGLESTGRAICLLHQLPASSPGTPSPSLICSGPFLHLPTSPSTQYLSSIVSTPFLDNSLFPSYLLSTLDRLTFLRTFSPILFRVPNTPRHV